MSNLLAIDASGDVLTLAVCRGETLWASERSAGPTASAEALLGVDALLKSAGLALRDLDAVAYGRGPGAFTGLRTACALAQGLALGAQLPLVGIDTLAAVMQSAWGHWASLREGRPQGLTLWALNDARMGEVYAGAWHLPPRAEHMGQAQLLQAHRVCSPQAWLSAWQGAPPDALAGSGVPVHAQAWSGLAVPQLDTRLDARALMVLAKDAWLRGDAHDAAQAAPLYVRDKVAQTVAERQAQAVRAAPSAPQPPNTAAAASALPAGPT
jgi:tRNA threonylcarbamoyladenosine biosynthesis protein TsaB